MRRNCAARRVAGSQGQALIELALMIPLLFLLVVLSVDFGGFIYSWIEVSNAARAATNYGILGSVSAGFPATPTGTNILNLITADLGSLPNTSTTNPTVMICWNQNGTITTVAKQGSSSCPTSGSTAPPADPEAPTFFTVTVDITYTYTPFISTFSFPRLGISLPTFPTTVHRRVVMRYM